MLRALIKDITIAKDREPRQLLLQIRWQGGATETVELALPPKRPDAVRYPPGIVARIRQLAIDRDDDEIAASLDREGLKSATGKRFTASMISWVRFKHHIPGPARPSGMTVGEVAQRFGVKPSVVYYWIETGVIKAKRRKPGLPYGITLTDETDRDLRERVAKSTRIKTSSRNSTGQGAV
jgi:MerR-like DNA binding protein